jgi:hypothetical protein
VKYLQHRGHFAPIATTNRILREGYYWTTIFKDSYVMIRKCVSCQRFSEKVKRSTMSLHSITIEYFFSQWGLDLSRPINPKFNKGHFYILTATDYFTKWKEVVDLNKFYYEELINSLKENILSRFGIPDKFIKDNGSIYIYIFFVIFSMTCGTNLWLRNRDSEASKPSKSPEDCTKR